MGRSTALCYVVRRLLVVFIQFQVSTLSSLDLDINHCKQEWVQVSSTVYNYRVDCSNLGFDRVPSGLPALTSELLLNGNSISSLDDQAIAGLTSLHTLDLSGNDIVTIDRSVFRNNKNLKRINLSRNKLRCDTQIWWLVEHVKKLDEFKGICFSPRPIRQRPIALLKEEDLSVDCLSVKQLRNASEDGEYNIRVFARDNSKTQLCIYCHQMSSSQPKEYLTLPAGVHHNYVKIRMDDDTCRYNNTDTGLQKKLDAIKHNTSYFVRVRISLSTLTILATDTTFGSNTFLNYGQPGLCGDTICSGGVAKIDLRGTYFHIKDNQKSQTTKRCDAAKCIMCNISTTIPLSLMDPRKYPYQACTLPLGLQSGLVQNSSMNASSSARGSKPYHARLNSLKYSGWCAESLDQKEFVRVDLGKEKTLSGISIQGHKTENNWVKRYKLFYSSHGEDVFQYKEFGNDIILVGNRDRNTVATHWFQPRFRARYITVNPYSWNGNETHGNKICMRIELYGCENDITSYVIKPRLGKKCLTLDTSTKRETYPLIMQTGCTGANFMFTFHTKRLMHTQTGLCLNLGESDELILNNKCSSSNIQFQKVRQKGEAFLIKDNVKNKCARMYSNDNALTTSGATNLQLNWKYCLRGGFTILFMSREGVSAFLPIFAATVSTITTDLFKSIKLECRVHADPHTIFRWSKHSLDTPPYNSFQNGYITEKKELSTVRFPNVTWNDRGTYYCNAWNSVGNTSRKYQINVNAIQWFDHRPSLQKIIWGYTAVFHCVSRGIPTPNVKWVKYIGGRMKKHVVINTNHSRYSVLENSTLVISRVNYTDQGVYMCVSTSPKLIRNASALLKVYVTQKFTSTPKSSHVLFGEGTKFDCVSRGLPPPKVHWEMELNNIEGRVTIDESFNHQYEVLPNNSLAIKQVTFADEGQFICISETPGLTVNRSAPLTVFVTQNFTTSPTDEKILYGYNAKFECVSIGVPNPIVTWVKMEGKNKLTTLSNSKKFQVTANKTLHIIDVRYEDEGTYACFSRTPRLKRNVSATLDVYVTQNFTMFPVDKKILYGYNVTFPCVSVGIPKPKVSWYKKVRNSLQYITSNSKYSLTTNSLQLRNVDYDDEGEYICDSESPRLKRNVSAVLDVYVTQNFTSSPTDQRVLYNYNATFVCVSIGIPKPSVLWGRKTREGYKMVGSRSKYELGNGNTILTIINATYEDEGEYMCFSRSPRLHRNASALLDVYVTQKFDVIPVSSKVLYGNSYALHCASTGIPRPRIIWRFQHINSQSRAPVVTSRRYAIDGNSTLKLLDVTLKQSGTYYCISESPGLTATVNATVSVYVTQNFTKVPKSQKLIKGQNAVFHCESVGSPKPTLLWKYKENGADVARLVNDVKNDRIKLHADNSLIINDIQNKDEGNYICVSNSPGLSVNRTARLIVYIKPAITLSAKSKHLHIGQSTSVSCNVSGDPMPTIIWYKLVDGQAESLSNTNMQYSFRRVSKTDQGKYICEATNDVGLAKATYNLKVTATCLLDLIEHSTHTPNKYVYMEKEKIVVHCNRGFRMSGWSNLVCMSTGRFDHPIPTCKDINECNDTVVMASDFGSGVGEERIGAVQSDDEPETCDYNAQCYNTIGSYRCRCDEGYLMVKNKCEFAPPGSESNRPGLGSTRPPTTIPPPQQFDWLHSLNDFYTRDMIQEDKYLSKLRSYSRSITRMQYNSWKVDGIMQLINSLKLAVNLADKNSMHTTPKRALEAIRAFGAIVSDVLNTELQHQWRQVNEKSNGSIVVMKYLEEFILVKAESFTMKDFIGGPMEEIFPSLDVKIVAVKDVYKEKSLEISMLQGEVGNIVDIPVENYKQFKGRIGIGILYKNLHELLPKPHIKELKKAKIQSKLFTLSFSSPAQTQLIKPVQIKFKLNSDEEIPEKRLCSYWDFKKPYGGSWSTDGCQSLNISTATEVICECSHLTNFAIIVPQKTAMKVAYLTFTLSVAVGVAACIILAFCTCMSHICCSGYSTGDRQTIMTNITIVIIVGLIVFAGGVFVSSMKLVPESSTYSTYFCFSIIGIIQLLAVACFGWIFAESIHILFSTRPAIEKGSSNLCLFYILGWVVPVGLLAITGVLVYLDKFQLQSRCSLKVSFYMVGILVGAPSVCYIIATVVVYILICFSTSKNVEILGAMKVSHARRALLCSGFLMVFHLALLAAITLYLHFNGDAMFHHILGGVAAAEGIYLIVYHMFLDRMAGKPKAGSPRTRQRNSYSTKETITYAPNGNVGNGNKNIDDTDAVVTEQNRNEQKRFLIKTSSKRSSVDNTKPTPPQLRTPDETNSLEWDSHVSGDMYGDSDINDLELKPMLTTQKSDEMPPTIYEEERDYSIETGLDTFGQPNVDRNDTLPRSYNSLPRKKRENRDFDEVSNDGSFRPTKRPGKASSIVSIETHTSTSSQQGLPIYFPSAPPHHEIFFDEKKKPPESIVTSEDCYPESADASRPASFGIDSDRMSNLSSELSNILYELQAFNTDRHPSEQPPSDFGEDENSNANTLPHRRANDAQDLSKTSSTFKPGRAYAKTEVQFEQNKPPTIEHHRVRVLRGRSRAEADPSDGLHGNSDSIYSSL